MTTPKEKLSETNEIDGQEYPSDVLMRLVEKIMGVTEKECAADVETGAAAWEHATEILARIKAAREEGRREKISAYDFVLGADACALLDVLSRAKCDDCSGQGERNDAEAGDISFNSWVCKSCDGKGWNKQAVVEIIGAVGPISPQPEIRNLPTNAPEGESE
ncbi:hypothetical protein ATL17_1626 [Maritalea mobilis]|uniref:Uncharacterized protein n=1 Tax=Maritalea mobilis TaxID=483324 RepID=A0A4R6VJ46_9HYPH|nr:hypothetical protein [Maritalea mobilis]TDQ63619.1 hypothetical protein ATL17_1626 [Maritalea mobilis]